MAVMPCGLSFAMNCRMHRPRTKRMRKLVSKSLTRAGESWMPSFPAQCRNVPATISRPAAMPNLRKHTSPRARTSP